MLISRRPRFEVFPPRVLHATNGAVENQEVARESLPDSGRRRAEQYKVFRDDEAPEIFDVEEARHQEQHLPDESDAALDQYYGLNLKRGIRGVFDIEDLVELLRKENVDDIFVCYVPEDLKYVDHLVVCSGRSYRHMISTAEFVRRMFKIKRTKGDILPRIEGDKSRDWMAMDLGNIALHIFSPRAREEYDLESLWAIGPKYDRESQKPHNPYGDLFMAQVPSPSRRAAKGRNVEIGLA
ncbi:GL20701 [Drosophila persimilis]|uniref:Mitochondrial assembly of ribosomal large subunit protein 1 n=1 Tax=Drosophila persimilis TaxID=7234 RepID=B4H4C2_DROPE|nr:GL20701 [Drosophila persimilis]